MNTANEQDSNLNGDFQNSNLANSDSDKFARDYDKEPIILKNYERFFVANLLPFCIFATVVIMLGLDYFWPEFDKTPRQILITLFWDTLSCKGCYISSSRITFA